MLGGNNIQEKDIEPQREKSPSINPQVLSSINFTKNNAENNYLQSSQNLVIKNDLNNQLIGSMSVNPLSSSTNY